MNDIDWVRKYPGECCALVSRGEDLQPCEKVAVAVCADGEDADEDDPHWWPVCAHHTRKNHAVPLADLIKALS